ncbi:hypothetical protein DV706_19670 (plasmid) [Natronorubrum bangense]|uniref:Uncharacterized protein n=2 Tax=Natronorubrum bangense TaxID=61858 RepID=L9W5P6_9EURY|nr:hypothetical protein C494_16028 [Natronorubrum bangense JCM 10635]QCC56761.1 hypothetical protein DV706_19670 [Natronorubrum bangense]
MTDKAKRGPIEPRSTSVRNRSTRSSNHKKQLWSGRETDRHTISSFEHTKFVRIHCSVVPTLEGAIH